MGEGRRISEETRDLGQPALTLFIWVGLEDACSSHLARWAKVHHPLQCQELFKCKVKKQSSTTLERPSFGNGPTVSKSRYEAGLCSSSAAFLLSPEFTRKSSSGAFIH